MSQMTGNAPRISASAAYRTPRRTLLGAGMLGAAVALVGFDWPSRGIATPWHGTDVSASLPPLRFAMQDASTGQTVGAAAFRGEVVLLTFGYSACPDACPLTLAHLAHVLQALGPAAGQVRVLFVTVDPARDTLPVLRDYTAQFAPGIVGMRGDADALAAFARRYRVAYAVTPASGGQPYQVTHSSLVYAFDRDGAARLIFGGLATGSPDLAGMTADLRRLLAEPRRQGFWARLAAVG